jgi:hypothetical protein
MLNARGRTINRHSVERHLLLHPMSSGKMVPVNRISFGTCSRGFAVRHKHRYPSLERLDLRSAHPLHILFPSRLGTC